MLHRTIFTCFILSFASSVVLASELKGRYVMKQADSELNTKMNDYMSCINSGRNGMHGGPNAKNRCRPELEAALQSAPKELRTKISSDLLNTDLPQTSQSPDAKTHDDPTALATLRDAPPNALARQAVMNYFDCVTNHRAFPIELEAAQEGCFEVRSHIAALLPEGDAVAVTAKLDKMLMARWRNDSARAGVQK